MSDVEVDPERFDRWVRETYEALPSWVRELMEEEPLPLHVVDEPPASYREAFGPGLLGIYAGPSRAERYERIADEPPRIELYRNVFLRLYSDPEVIRTRIRRTVIHEVGHFLGMEEPELHAWEQRLEDPPSGL